MEFEIVMLVGRLVCQLNSKDEHRLSNGLPTSPNHPTSSSLPSSSFAKTSPNPFCSRYTPSIALGVENAPEIKSKWSQMRGQTALNQVLLS